MWLQMWLQMLNTCGAVEVRGAAVAAAGGGGGGVEPPASVAPEKAPFESCSSMASSVGITRGSRGAHWSPSAVKTYTSAAIRRWWNAESEASCRIAMSSRSAKVGRYLREECPPSGKVQGRFRGVVCSRGVPAVLSGTRRDHK